ncbi:MAG: hypothetical protein FWC69_01050 [Defluviitaleaceae bacterium]|nr:hypothetical protein [Defluviitaleaceae bacterium]
MKTKENKGLKRIIALLLAMMMLVGTWVAPIAGEAAAEALENSYIEIEAHDLSNSSLEVHVDEYLNVTVLLDGVVNPDLVFEVERVRNFVRVTPISFEGIFLQSGMVGNISVNHPSEINFFGNSWSYHIEMLWMYPEDSLGIWMDVITIWLPDQPVFVDVDENGNITRFEMQVRPGLETSDWPPAFQGEINQPAWQNPQDGFVYYRNMHHKFIELGGPFIEDPWGGYYIMSSLVNISIPQEPGWGLTSVSIDEGILFNARAIVPPIVINVDEDGLGQLSIPGLLQANDWSDQSRFNRDGDELTIEIPREWIMNGGLWHPNRIVVNGIPESRVFIDHYDLLNNNGNTKVTIDLVDRGEPNPSLSVTKTASPTVAQPGEEVTHTITVTNTGNVRLEGVRLTTWLDSILSNLDVDTLPRNVEKVSYSSHHEIFISFWITNLAIGESVTITLTTDVDPSTPSGSTIYNSVSASQDIRGLGYASSVVHVMALGETPEPSISITKTASAEDVAPGEDVAYTIVVTNTGNIDLRSVRVMDFLHPLLENIVVDELPEGVIRTSSWGPYGREIAVFNMNTLPAGESITITLTTTVSLDAPINTIIANHATVSSPTFAFQSFGDYAIIRVIEAGTTPPPVDPGLSFTKNISSETVAPGEEIAYTFVIENIGNVHLENVRVISVSDNLLEGLVFDTLPDGVTQSPGSGGLFFTISSLPIGQSISLTFSATVSADALSGDRILIFASATSTRPSIVNGATSSINVVAAGSNASITKSVSPANVLPGGDVTHALVVTNTGNVDLVHVNVFTPLDPLLINPILGTMPNGVSGNINEGLDGFTASFHIASLPVGASITLTFTATLSPNATPGATITNRSSVGLIGTAIFGYYDASITVATSNVVIPQPPAGGATGGGSFASGPTTAPQRPQGGHPAPATTQPQPPVADIVPPIGITPDYGVPAVQQPSETPQQTPPPAIETPVVPPYTPETPTQPQPLPEAPAAELQSEEPARVNPQTRDSFSAIYMLWVATALASMAVVFGTTLKLKKQR